MYTIELYSNGYKLCMSRTSIGFCNKQSDLGFKIFNLKFNMGVFLTKVQWCRYFCSSVGLRFIGDSMSSSDN